MDIETIARVAHEAIRALQLAYGEDNPSLPWEEAPQWQKTSAFQGVAAAQRGMAAAQLHEEWMRHQLAQGWRHGPVKDVLAQIHPHLVPYQELPEEERVKDALLLAVTGALTDPAPAAAESAAGMRPTVGRMVHYVSYGTPGGEYTSECRAAIVTAVEEDRDKLGRGQPVSLAVLNPEGVFFKRGCRLSAGSREGGTWHWPECG